MIDPAQPYLVDGRLDLSRVYVPIPKQVVFHQSKARFRAGIGGRGSGKSQALLWEAIKYCIKFPGCHVLLLRKDFTELKKGLIQDLQTDVPPELYTYNASDHIAKFFNGSLLFFGHAENARVEDLNQYLSASFSFIGVEEGGEFPYAVWDFLQGSNRNKVAGPIPTMALATNPYGIGYGWIKTLFIDKKPVAQIEGSNSYDPKDYFFVHSTLLDNPHLMRKDPGYIERLNLLSPELRQKMLYGDLDSVSGQYFTNFEPSRHIIKAGEIAERIKWEDWQTAWLGSDYGLAHFWCTYWLRLALVRTGDVWKRKCVVFKELCEHDKSIADYARLVAQRNNGQKLAYTFFSPERFNRTDPQHTPADQFTTELRKFGLPPATRASNERIAGATFLYSMFDSDSIVLIEESCPNLVRAIPTLIRDPDDIEDVLKAETLEDDCYDGFRYGVISLLHPKAKPAEVEMREKAQLIDDPIAKHFFVVKEQQRLAEKTHGFKPNVIPSWQRELQ